VCVWYIGVLYLTALWYILGAAADARANDGGQSFWDGVDLSALPQYPGYITLESGLQVREDRVGLPTAPAATCGDRVKVCASFIFKKELFFLYYRWRKE
jgi:hypothetical protein